MLLILLIFLLLSLLVAGAINKRALLRIKLIKIVLVIREVRQRLIKVGKPVIRLVGGAEFLVFLGACLFLFDSELKWSEVLLELLESFGFDLSLAGLLLLFSLLLGCLALEGLLLGELFLLLELEVLGFLV